MGRRGRGGDLGGAFLTDSTATLLIAAPDAGNPVDPATEVLGLSVRRRAVLAGERAGFTPVLAAPDGVPPAIAPGRVVLLSPHVLVQTAWLRELASMPLAAETLFVDAGVAAVVTAADPHAVTAALNGFAGHAGFDALVERLAKQFPLTRRRLGGDGRRELRSEADIPPAEDWLLRSLVKETDGFMARHVDRKISLAVSRRLAPTALTPNGMTLISAGIGVAGALFFLSARPVSQLAGALLFLLHSILDGCDGELARLKFQESRFGGVLDFWSDNVVHVAVFLAMGAGWSRAIHEAWPAWLGVSAAVGTVLSAGLVYARTMRGTKEGPLFTSVTKGSATTLSRIADALARRDFIFLVVLLSAFGKAGWFLVLAAVGSPVFFLVLLWISFRGKASS